jgi:molecular chaperone GrpE
LEAFQAADTAAPQATQEGVRLIYEKLIYLLQQAGAQPMPLDKGTAFDAELHEAVTQMYTEDQSMQGKVLEVLEKGYLMNEKVLRFAKVVTGA